MQYHLKIHLILTFRIFKGVFCLQSENKSMFQPHRSQTSSGHQSPKSHQNIFGSSPQILPRLNTQGFGPFFGWHSLTTRGALWDWCIQDKQERCWLMAYKPLASFNKAETWTLISFRWVRGPGPGGRLTIAIICLPLIDVHQIISAWRLGDFLFRRHSSNSKRPT